MSAAPANQSEIRDLYRELILDHARSPRHFGVLPGATHSAQGSNPLCGDSLQLYIEMQADGIINAISFDGNGCAISIASASLMSETVLGLDASAALNCFANVVGRLNGTTDGNGIDLGKLRALDGVKEYPSRVKCATLAWHALRSALNNDPQSATTE